jgi:hypothetical protein
VNSRIAHTSVDCHDAYTLSVWWAETLGKGNEFCVLRGDEEAADPYAQLVRRVPRVTSRSLPQAPAFTPPVP